MQSADVSQHARPGGLRSLGGAVLSTTAGDLLGRAAALLTTLLVARALTPGDFGAFVGLLAVAMFAAGVWDLGYSSLSIREVAAGRASVVDAIAGLLRSRIRVAPAWLAIIAGGTLILASSTGGGISLVTFVGFACASAFAATSLAPLALLRANLDFRSASLAQASGRWLTAALVAVGASGLGGSLNLESVGLMAAAGEWLTLAVAWYFLQRRQGRSSDARHAGANLSLRAAAPFAANGLLSIAYNRLDVIVVAALTSAADVAAYAPASRIQDVLYLVPSVVGVVTFPIIARTWAKPGGADAASVLVAQFIGAGLAIAVPVAVIGSIFAPQAIRLVLGPEYLDAVTTTRILIWFLPLAVIQSPLLAALGATGHAGDTTRIFAMTFAVAMCMHLLLDPIGGAAGAATASLSRDIAAVPITIAYAARAGLIRWPGGTRPRAQDVVRGAR